MDETIFVLEKVRADNLHPISFTIKKGQFITIIGPSGAGKSSLLNLFNRLKEPTEGVMTYKGSDIREYPIPELRRNIGMVFQSPNLFPGTVEDNIKYGPELKGEWDSSKGPELLKLVQLPEDYVTREVDHLSGGEKQRVAMIRTLANEPKVLLLDEPTSALDERTIEELEKVLLDLSQEGKTILMVTHDLEQAERLGQRTLFLKDGKLVEIGDTKDLFRSPQSEDLRRFLRGNDS